MITVYGKNNFLKEKFENLFPWPTAFRPRKKVKRMKYIALGDFAVSPLNMYTVTSAVRAWRASLCDAFREAAAAAYLHEGRD